MNFLEKELIYSIFDIVKTKEQIKILLNQCYDIFTFLFACNKNFLLINDIIGNQNKITVIKYINPNTLSINKEDYNEFISKFKEILEKENELNYQIFDFDEVIQIYLKKIKKLQNLERCFVLNDLIKSYPNLISQKIRNISFETFHEIFIYLAQKNEITSDNLLEIITKKDIYYFENKYEAKRYRPLEIFDNISLRAEPEIFFIKFRENKIWNYFLCYGKDFIEFFLEKIRTLSYFHRIFWLFPKEIFSTIYSKNSVSVSEKYQELKLSDHLGQYNTDLLREDFFNIIEILTNSKNSCSDFLKAIETFKSKYVNNLYLDLISSKEIQLTENTFKLIMKYLSKNLNDNNSINNETFLYLLEKSNGKEEFVKAIIEVISSCFLKKDNFLGEDDTNYKIFKLLYKFNYFNIKPKWFVSSQYYDRTIDSIKDIINILSDLKITFTEFNFLFRYYGDKLSIIKD